MKTKILLLGLLMVLGAVQLAAQPLVRSGWTTTSDPATARAALGVGTGGATNGIQQLNGFGTNTTFEGWTLFNSIKTNNGVVYYPLLTGNRVLSLDANKAVSSSTVTTTELGYLSGTTELLTTSIGNLRGATNGLNTRVNNLEGATNGLTTRVNGHDTSIGNLQGATNGLTTRLNGHDTDIGNLQGATNGLASDIATKADTNSPTLFFPRILNGGGTSNQVWTLTNTVTGEGEWRTVSGVGGGAFPDGGTATNATLKGVTTFAQDAQIQINWVPMNPATLRTNEGMSQTAILHMNSNIVVSFLGTNTSPYFLRVNGSNFTVTVGGDVYPTRGGGDETLFSFDFYGGPLATNVQSDYLTSAQFLSGISDETGTGSLVASDSPSFTTSIDLAVGTATLDVIENNRLTLAASTSDVHIIAANTNAYTRTNIFGTVELAFASTILIDGNQAQRWIVTNRATGNLWLAFTNMSPGLEYTVKIPGEVTGGTSRTITMTNQGNHFVDMNNFGTAIATGLARTLTNGNMIEINNSYDRWFGGATNRNSIITGQALFQ